MRHTTFNIEGEMQRLRFWQESALTALTAYLYTVEIPSGTRSFEAYAKKAAQFSFEIAEQMHAQHGPSVDELLKGKL